MYRSWSRSSRVRFLPGGALGLELCLERRLRLGALKSWRLEVVEVPLGKHLELGFQTYLHPSTGLKKVAQIVSRSRRPVTPWYKYLDCRST